MNTAQKIVLLKTALLNLRITSIESRNFNVEKCNDIERMLDELLLEQPRIYAKPGSNPCAEVVLPIMGNYAPGIFSVLGAEILKRHTRPDIE